MSATDSLHRLGPSVSYDDDGFHINENSYLRRQYRVDAALEPIQSERGNGRRRGPIDSQLDRLPPPADLAAEVPTEPETFTYVSPTMAHTLNRMAEVDATVGQRGFVLLIGPTGCGKTTLAKTYCILANQPCTELSFSGDTSLTDFYTRVEVVRRSDRGPSTLTVPGPAIDAMLRGKKLLINEINMLPADVLNVFSQAMDTGRLALSGTDRGNIEIEVHGDFGIIGTANPNYIGTLEIGRAMERRFGRGLGYIEVDFLPPVEEAPALKHEFDREALFSRYGIEVSLASCRQLVDCVSRLRADPQIGRVIQGRLSTRMLLHWLQLAQITGFSLPVIAKHAILTTCPADARSRAMEIIYRDIGSLKLDNPSTRRLDDIRLDWPAIQPDEVLPIEKAPRLRNPRRPNSRERPVIHRIRYQRTFADGIRVLIGEPFYAQEHRWVGLGLRIRAYDADGRQIVDPSRLDDISDQLRDQYGLNVPRQLGRRPRMDEVLPCLTSSSIRALQVLEASMLIGRPAFLVGPTGSGKSTLARTYAFLTSKTTSEFSFTGETAKNDLSATRRLIDGLTSWQTQAFLEAMGRGGVTIINEYNLAYPDVHSLINSLFDKGAKLSLPDGEVHHMDVDSRVIATGYLEGPGVKPLNEGVENRFGALIDIDYPPIEEEIALLRYLTPETERNSVGHCVRFVDYCRRLTAGQVDPKSMEGLSSSAKETLRQAARRAAISTAEMVAIARACRRPGDFVRRLKAGVLEGAGINVRRVLEPVLQQYDVR